MGSSVSCPGCELMHLEAGVLSDRIAKLETRVSAHMQRLPGFCGLPHIMQPLCACSQFRLPCTRFVGPCNCFRSAGEFGVGGLRFEPVLEFVSSVRALSALHVSEVWSS